MSRFADPVPLVLARLGQLGGPAAYGAVPKPRPDRFRLVQHIGTARLNPGFRLATITVECWDKASEQAAQADGEVVADWLQGWEMVPGRGGWMGGPYPQADPDTGCTRSTMAFQVVQHAQQP